MIPTATNGKQGMPGGELCSPSVRKERMVLSEWNEEEHKEKESFESCLIIGWCFNCSTSQCVY